LGGAQSLDSFKRIIDEEIKLAKERIRNGANTQTYYDNFVIKGGKKGL